MIKLLPGRINPRQQWDKYRYTFLGGLEANLLFHYLYIHEGCKGVRWHCFNTKYIIFNVGSTVEHITLPVPFLGLESFVFPSASISQSTAPYFLSSLCESFHSPEPRHPTNNLTPPFLFFKISL